MAQDAILIPPEAIVSRPPATQNKVHVTFPGRLIVIGFGSIGQGVLPLILRHIGDIDPKRITIVTAEPRGRDEAKEYGIRFIEQALTRENFEELLAARWPGRFPHQPLGRCFLDRPDRACRNGALYIDTCIEPWAGGYTDAPLSPSLRSNYALREQALALRERMTRIRSDSRAHARRQSRSGQHFVKQALVDLAGDLDDAGDPDRARTGRRWRASARHQGHPHRRARYPGRRPYRRKSANS